MDNKGKRREEYTDVEATSEEVKPKKNKKKRKKNQNQNEVEATSEKVKPEKNKKNQNQTEVEATSEEVKPKKNKKKRKKNQNQNEEFDDCENLKHESDDCEKLKNDQKIEATTEPKKVDDQVNPQFSYWSSSSEEPEYTEDTLHPNYVCVGNMDPNITEDEIKHFFKRIGKATVELRPVTTKKGIITEMQALVSFETLEETQRASMLYGTDLSGRAARISRLPLGLMTLVVTEFDDQISESSLLEQLSAQLEWPIQDIFLPKSSSTGFNLGFAYLKLSIGNQTEDAVQKFVTENDIIVKDVRGDEYFVQILKVHLKAWVTQSITTEGRKADLQETIDALKNKIEENRRRETDKEPPFSWRTRKPELFVHHYLQLENDCWAITLFRGHYAAHQLTYSSPSSLTNVDIIKQGVNPRHLLSGEGIDKVKNTKEFMLGYCKEVEFHHRPKTDNEEDHEAFEKNIICLLKQCPVGVMIDVLPSSARWDWDELGVFIPTVNDLIRKSLEKPPYHGLFLASHDTTEEGVDFWELQESAGEDHGDKGFIKLARHNRMIKQLIVFKV
ncbi:unnamed protein product [Arabidopsis halleri]